MKKFLIFLLSCLLMISMEGIEINHPRKHISNHILPSFLIDFEPNFIFQNPNDMLISQNFSDFNTSNFENFDVFSDGIFNNMKNIQKKFFKNFGHNIMKSKGKINNKSNFSDNFNNIFHTEEIYETFENDGNSTKRIKIGQIKDNIDGQNVTTQLIHEADDNHGNKLSPEIEAKELNKHKEFFGNLKPNELNQ